MNSTAPARSGTPSCRHVPRFPVALVALALSLFTAACAIDPPGPDDGAVPAAQAATGTAGTDGKTGPDTDAGTASGPGAATDGSADDAETDAGTEADNDTEADGDALPATAARDAGDEGPIPEMELNPQLLFQLLASEIAAQRGQLASASHTYFTMAEQTRDPRLARRATELALADHATEFALPAAELWRTLSPDSRRAAQTLEMLLLGTGRLADAEPLLAERLARARAGGGLAAAYGHVEQALLRTREPAPALAMLERLAAPDTQVAAARLALAALAAATGDNARTVREARTALELAPDDEMVAVRAARSVADAEAGPDTAITLLENFVARKPDALEARFTLARLLASAGRDEAARSQFDKLLAREPENPALLFSVAQFAWQSERADEAEAYLKRYLNLPDSIRRNDDPAWLFLGQIAESTGRIDEAIDHYGRVDRGEQFMPALVRRAQLIARQGRLDEARQLLRNTRVNNNRDRVRLISAEAQVLRAAQRYDEALALLGDALTRLPENPDLLYDHAMAAERVGRLDLLEASLRKLIALHPDHAHAYNALGYTFADRKIRLDEARQLIEKALSLQPDNAHILDSMGWVHYRAGDLDAAADYLRRAWAGSQEAEVGAHLGEVLWARGDHDEARTIWREARKLDPDNAVLIETLQRFGIEP